MASELKSVEDRENMYCEPRSVAEPNNNEQSSELEIVYNSDSFQKVCITPKLSKTNNHSFLKKHTITRNNQGIFKTNSPELRINYIANQYRKEPNCSQKDQSYLIRTLSKLMKDSANDKDNKFSKKRRSKNFWEIASSEGTASNEQSIGLIKSRKEKSKSVSVKINFIKLRAMMKLKEDELNDSFDVQKRRVIRFSNIHDSESDVDQYDYHDFQQKWYSIHPKSKISRLIEFTKQVVVTIGAVFFPLELVYYDRNSGPTQFFHIFLELLLMACYLLNMITGFEDSKKRQINYEVRSIIRNIYNSQNVLWVYYEQITIALNHFAVEIIGIIMNTQMTNDLYDFLIISKFLLFMNLNEWIILNPILKQLNDIMLKNSGHGKQGQSSIIVSLFRFFAILKVLAYYLIFIHTASCVWIYLYQYANYNLSNESWVFYFNFSGKDFTYLYITSFYYCLTTFVSVGYGDIHPYSHSERLFCIVFMFLGVLFYSFLISLISSLVVRGESKRAIFNSKKKILDEINSESKIDEELYNRISNSIAHSIQSFNNDKLALIENLPSNLKDILLLTIHSRLISNLEYFDCSNKNFILFTCSLLKNHHYDRNYKLLAFNQKIFEMIFILKGHVSVYLNDELEFYRLTRFKSGEHFLDNFLDSNEQFSPYNILTKGTTNEILSLSKENYFLIKDYFPSAIQSKLEAHNVRYQIIEQLRLGANTYFQKHGTLKNYRNYSMGKINVLIEKELQIYDPASDTRESSLTCKFKTLRNSKSVKKGSSTMVVTNPKAPGSEKKSKFNPGEIFDEVKNKRASCIKSLLKKSNKSKVTSLGKESISKRYKDEFRIKPSSRGSSRQKLELANIKRISKRFASNFAEDFRKGIKKSFKEDNELIVYYNHFTASGHLTESDSCSFNQRIFKAGYSSDNGSRIYPNKLSNNSISTYNNAAKKDSKVFLLKIDKSKKGRSQKITKTMNFQRDLVSKLFEEIKTVSRLKSFTTKTHFRSSLVSSSNKMLKLVRENEFELQAQIRVATEELNRRKLSEIKSTPQTGRYSSLKHSEIFLCQCQTLMNRKLSNLKL